VVRQGGGDARRASAGRLEVGGHAAGLALTLTPLTLTLTLTRWEAMPAVLPHGLGAIARATNWLGLGLG
jgi:hypothetical protein